MDVLVDRAAGLDVHKDVVVACVRTPGEDGGRVSEVRSFGTTTRQLCELADWLAARGVTRVGMESTGVYWRPVYYLLEERFEVWLLNAQHMRNVPGRKTDVQDAEWCAQLLEHGLVRPSFVPPPPIRELRTLTRYRRTQVEERTREVQRLDKVLQDAGLKLSSVASDILGKSGRDILDALVAGQRDPAQLAELARGRLRSKIPLLREALTGHFGDTHAVVVGAILAKLDYLDSIVARLDARIEEMVAPFAAERDLLTTIPGVDRVLATAILAEVGVRMSVFETAGRLASWAGMCPGQHESAGKRRSGRARHGDTWLQRNLALAATGAARTKDTYLSAQYARLVGRRGKTRARKAVGHSILVAVFYILAGGVPYQDLGGDYFLKRNNPARRARKSLNDLRSLGWTVIETPEGVTCVRPQAA